MLLGNRWCVAFAAMVSLAGVACGTSGGQGSDVPTTTGAATHSPSGTTTVSNDTGSAPMGKRAAPLEVRKLSDDEVKTRITPLLQADEKPAHGVFEGPFGPEQGVTLVLTFSSKGGPSRLLGWVLLGAENKRIDLPDLSDSQYVDTVSAVVPMNIDNDSASEVVILSTVISGAGPTAGQPYPHNVVLDWDGSKFVRLADVEKSIASAANAEDVKKNIKRP